MNKYAMQAILKRLIEIKNRVNIDKNLDITDNLLEYTYNRKKHKPTFISCLHWLNSQFTSWPKCHMRSYCIKDTTFPVGGWREYRERIVNKSLWDNPKRLELLDFLIIQAKKQLEEMKE